jgi:hypothetical protein
MFYGPFSLFARTSVLFFSVISEAAAYGTSGGRVTGEQLPLWFHPVSLRLRHAVLFVIQDFPTGK